MPGNELSVLQRASWQGRLLAASILRQTGVTTGAHLAAIEGRRTSSTLPELVELVMAKPLLSAGMVAKTLDVTPQAVRRIVLELGLREMTGRGGFGLGGNMNEWSERTIDSG